MTSDRPLPLLIRAARRRRAALAAAPVAAVVLASLAVGALGGYRFGARRAGAASRALAAEPAEPADRADPCALPGGVELAVLGAADRSWVARRAVLCADQRHGRISLAAYQEEVARLDRPRPAPAGPPTPAIVWATSVRARSSEYSANGWAAARVLGPPDVARPGGDDANAWTSASADGQIEFLEVGFEPGVRACGVDVVETLNPGAITEIAIVTADGGRHVVLEAAARAPGVASLHRTVAFDGAEAPVVAVRVTLDARAVPGWNEIDAIGLRPCGER